MFVYALSRYLIYLISYIILIFSAFSSHLCCLCWTVISKRIELESRGWSQIGGHSLLIMNLAWFFNFRLCIAKKNATLWFFGFWWFGKKKHILLNHQKTPIGTQNRRRGASGPFFSDSSRNFWSKTPLFRWKKICFDFFIYYIKLFNLFSLFFTTTTYSFQSFQFRRKRIATH